MIYWVLYLLFNNSLGTVDRSRASKWTLKKAKALNCITSTLGFALVLVAIGLIIKNSLNARYDRGDAAARFFGAILSRCLSYLVYWITIFFVYFNPLVAWGETETYPEPGLKSKFAMLGDMFGVGQWRIQKQYFQGICFDAAKDMKAMGLSPDAGAVAKRGTRPKPMHYTPQCLIIC